MSGHTPKPAIRLWMVDAMFTLLASRQTNRRQMVVRIYRDDGRIKESIRDRTIMRSIGRHRARFSKDLLDDDYWLHVNLAVLNELTSDRAIGLRAEAAQRIHKRLISDERLFRVDQTLLAVIRRLRSSGVRVVIASNQQEATLAKLLEFFSLTGELDAVYTSERLQARKPTLGFWQQILAEEGVGAGEARHIGNSPRSDTGAAALGIRTAIIDAHEELERCRLHPDRLIAGLNADETQIIRENLASGLIVPVASATHLRRCMEQQSMI